MPSKPLTSRPAAGIHKLCPPAMASATSAGDSRGPPSWPSPTSAARRAQLLREKVPAAAVASRWSTTVLALIPRRAAMASSGSPSPSYICRDCSALAVARGRCASGAAGPDAGSWCSVGCDCGAAGMGGAGCGGIGCSCRRAACAAASAAAAASGGWPPSLSCRASRPRSSATICSGGWQHVSRGRIHPQMLLGSCRPGHQRTTK